MFTYFLQVNFCWSLFYGLYYALLSRETFFTLNRIYLIISLLAGLILPIAADWLRTETPLVTPILDSIMLPTFVVGMQTQAQELVLPLNTEGGITWTLWTVFSTFYFMGVGVMALRFLKGLNHLFQIFKTANFNKNKGILVAYTEGVTQPFSFFNFIFINPKTLQDIDFQNIMAHEKAHAQQGHSFDVVFLEVLNIVFWCSPLVYLYKNSLRIVHEYLADAAVLRSVSKKQYGLLLVQQAQSGKALALGNPFFSQLKKRLIMMARNPSKRQALVKYAFTFPVFLLLVSFLASPNNAVMSATGNVLNETSPIGDMRFNIKKKALSDEKPLQKSNENPLKITLAGLENGAISAEIVQKQTQFRLIQPMGKTCDVQSFEVYKTSDSGEKTEIFHNTGSQFKAKVLNLLKSVEDGDILIFQNIKTRCPNDVDAQAYPSMAFEIKGQNTTEVYRTSPFYVDTKDYSYDGGTPYGDRGAFGFTTPNVLPKVSSLNRYLTMKDTTLPILTNVEEQPEFMGGQNEMFRWLSRNIKYPTLARERQVEGTVYLGFVVETDGSLSNIVVKKTAKEPSVDTIVMVDPNTYKTQTKYVTNNDGKVLDDEALRVVKTMPSWKVGKDKGKPVRVSYTLPIKFKLE